MATLVSDLINEAFLNLRAIDPGVGITSAEQADAFMRLNQLLASWSAEQFAVYTEAHDTGLTLTAGTATYTVGTSANGATLAIASTPVRITSAFATTSIGTESPIDVVSWDEFAARVVDPFGSSSIAPKVMAADNEYPLINIRLFPKPAASPATLTINSWTAITAFSAVGSTVSLPQGYERALHLALAVDLWPQYPKGDFGVLKGLADQAKNALMQLTQQQLLSGQGAPPQMLPGQTAPPPPPQAQQ